MSKAHKLFRMIFVLLLFSNIIQYAPELIARITILYTYVYVFLLLCRLSPTHQTLIIHLNCQNSTKAAGTLLSISNNGTTSQFRPPVPPNIPATRRRLTIELSNYQTIKLSNYTNVQFPPSVHCRDFCLVIIESVAPYLCTYLYMLVHLYNPANRLSLFALTSPSLFCSIQLFVKYFNQIAQNNAKVMNRVYQSIMTSHLPCQTHQHIYEHSTVHTYVYGF